MTPANPDLDLELTRLMAAPPAKVWRCWTEMDLFRQWWTPKPMVTSHAEIDFVPGGRFHTIMLLPDGGEHATETCVLLVEPARRLIFTDTLTAGFRPAETPMFGFTAIITMTPEGTGTRYHARAMHRTPEVRQRHDEMGFQEGWGSVSDQLAALAAGL